MKVIFVTRGWPTTTDPMSGNFEAVQAKALAKRGIDVTVLYLRKKSFAHIFELKAVVCKKEEGINVLSKTVSLTELPGVGITKNNRIDLWLRQRAFCRLYEYYKKIFGDADLIHAHFINQACDCKKVLEKYYVPFVITEHWSKMNQASLDGNLAILSEGYKWADKVISVSEALGESLKKKFGVDCTVIYNMVPDHFFNKENPINALNDTKAFRFISVGSLVAIKNFDIIIRALRKSRYLEKCELNIVGSGPNNDNLRQLIVELGLTNKVFLLGRKTPEEVCKLMAASDCFILTSRSETFGIVYIEAMAKGKPVIATTCGGPESFVNKSNGILIPTEDVEATTRAMDYMVENIDKYDSEAISRYCYENFSEEYITKKIIDVYHEAIDNHKTKV